MERHTEVARAMSSFTETGTPESDDLSQSSTSMAALR